MEFLCKKKGKSTAEMRMYSTIGAKFGGIGPEMVLAALDQVGGVDNLDIYLDSDGGSVDEGIAIHNILKRHKAKKRVIVDGLAASIATYIALAGDEIAMTSNSQWMIHKAWGIAAGDDDDFLAVSQGLRNATEIIRDAYVGKTGMPAADIYAMMKAETWMKADRALSLGFVDSVDQMTPALGAHASTYAMLSKFKNTPADLASAARQPALMRARMDMRTKHLNRRPAGVTA